MDALDALETVFASVLENYAFLFSDRVQPGDDGNVSGPWMKVEMRFTGPFKGELCLFCPEDFSREVAANVLGLEMDDEHVRMTAQDSLKELLNVTCGNFLTHVAGDKPVFELTVPKIAPVSEPEWRQRSADARLLHVQIGTSRAILRISIEGGNEKGVFVPDECTGQNSGAHSR